MSATTARKQRQFLLTLTANGGTPMLTLAASLLAIVGACSQSTERDHFNCQRAERHSMSHRRMFRLRVVPDKSGAVGKIPIASNAVVWAKIGNGVEQTLDKQSEAATFLRRCRAVVDVGRRSSRHLPAPTFRSQRDFRQLLERERGHAMHQRLSRSLTLSPAKR